MAWRHRSPEQIMRVTGCRVSVTESGSKAQVSFPPFTPADFDRSGNLSFQKLQAKLTSSRFLAYHIPSREGHTFLEYDVMTSERYTFMASSETHVAREFYAIPDGDALPALSVDLHLGYVGTSSLNSVTQLTEPSSGQVFATNTNTVVSVDKTTRKSTPLPDWWKDRYRSHVIGNQRLVCEQLQVPEETHRHNMTVTWSDIDGYKHTNYLSYVRYCYDTAMDAIHHKKLSRFHDDITSYLTKRMRALYKGESRAGHELSVACWENTQDPFTLHFDISKEGETLFQCTLEFYEPA